MLKVSRKCMEMPFEKPFVDMPGCGHLLLGEEAFREHSNGDVQAMIKRKAEGLLTAEHGLCM